MRAKAKSEAEIEAEIRAWLKHRAAKKTWNSAQIGDRRQLVRLSDMFGVGRDTFRSILKSEGWTLEPSPNAGLPFWGPNR